MQGVNGNPSDSDSELGSQDYETKQHPTLRSPGQDCACHNGPGNCLPCHRGGLASCTSLSLVTSLSIIDQSRDLWVVCLLSLSVCVCLCVRLSVCARAGVCVCVCVSRYIRVRVRVVWMLACLLCHVCVPLHEGSSRNADAFINASSSYLEPRPYPNRDLVILALNPNTRRGMGQRGPDARVDGPPQPQGKNKRTTTNHDTRLGSRGAAFESTGSNTIRTKPTATHTMSPSNTVQLYIHTYIHIHIHTYTHIYI